MDKGTRLFVGHLPDGPGQIYGLVELFQNKKNTKHLIGLSLYNSLSANAIITLQYSNLTGRGHGDYNNSTATACYDT